MFILMYVDQFRRDLLLSSPVAVSHDKERLKNQVNEKWYENCAGVWVTEPNDTFFYRIDEIREV